jgi:hypothetical protein
MFIFFLHEEYTPYPLILVSIYYLRLFFKILFYLSDFCPAFEFYREPVWFICPLSVHFLIAKIPPYFSLFFVFKYLYMDSEFFLLFLVQSIKKYKKPTLP